jgi:hypothetical protein
VKIVPVFADGVFTTPFPGDLKVLGYYLNNAFADIRVKMIACGFIAFRS